MFWSDVSSNLPPLLNIIVNNGRARQLSQSVKKCIYWWYKQNAFFCICNPEIWSKWHKWTCEYLKWIFHPTEYHHSSTRWRKCYDNVMCTLLGHAQLGYTRPTRVHFGPIIIILFRIMELATIFWFFLLIYYIYHSCKPITGNLSHFWKRN